MKGENLKKDWKKKENSQNTLLSRRLLWKRQVIIDTSLTHENFLRENFKKILGKVTRFGDYSSSRLKVIIR